jgi:RNA polymerase sigma-70 factor (ECF subfamily)
MTNESDTFYIERCLDGDPDDFRFLVRRYQGPLLAHLVAKLGNREAAEEAAQESLVRAYFKMDSLKEPDKFLGWLFGISNRVVLEQQRKQQKERLHVSVRQADEASPPPPTGADYGLEEAIARLPGGQRAVILLRYYSQMSCKTTAAQLDVPLGSVTKQLSRAYAQLKTMLAQRQPQEM